MQLSSAHDTEGIGADVVLVSLLMKSAVKFVIDHCSRGAMEIYYAGRDVVPAVAVLVRGSNVGINDVRTGDSPGVSAGKRCAEGTSNWSLRSSLRQCIRCCNHAEAPANTLSFDDACYAVCNANFK